MAPVTPYSAVLGDQDPVAAMRHTAERVAELTAGWSVRDYERSYEPGKWSARLILTHLAQSEVAFGARARMALSVPGYTAQSFDQDAWIAKETSLSGVHAAAAFVSLARMNAAFFESLTRSDRQAAFAHPEFGTLTVDWIAHQSAGHQLHHLKQLERIQSS